MMTSNDTVTVLLCGVGGQGTILAADLLAHAALESGYDAKVFRDPRHVAARRRGDHGRALRARGRAVHGVRPGMRRLRRLLRDHRGVAQPSQRARGRLPSRCRRVHPAASRAYRACFHARACARDAGRCGRTLIPAGDIAVGVGAPKSVNVVLLGALRPASTSRKRHGSASSRAACLPRPSMPTWQRFARASRSLARLRAGKGLKT